MLGRTIDLGNLTLVLESVLEGLYPDCDSNSKHLFMARYYFDSYQCVHLRGMTVSSFTIMPTGIDWVVTKLA